MRKYDPVQSKVKLQYRCSCRSSFFIYSLRVQAIFTLQFNYYFYEAWLKLLKYSNKLMWWEDGKPKDSSYLQCLTAVPSRVHHLLPSSHSGNWEVAEDAASPSLGSPIPALPSTDPLPSPAKPRAMCWKKQAHWHVCRWRMFLWLSQSARIKTAQISFQNFPETFGMNFAKIFNLLCDSPSVSYQWHAGIKIELPARDLKTVF